MNILCKRSNDQRQQIKSAYKNLYGEVRRTIQSVTLCMIQKNLFGNFILKDLAKDLTKELKGNSEELTLALLQPTDEYDASLLYKAMKVMKPF